MQTGFAQPKPTCAAARLRGTRIDVTQILQKEPKIQLDRGKSCSSPRCFREVGLSVMRVIFRMQAKESTWVSMNAPREHLGCRTCVISCYFIIRKVNANWVRASPKQSSTPPWALQFPLDTSQNWKVFTSGCILTCCRDQFVDKEFILRCPPSPVRGKKRSGNPKWRRGYWSLAQILGSAWLHRIEPIGLVCWVPRGTNPLIQDCWGLPELTGLQILWFGFIMVLDHMMSGISDVEYGISNARVSNLEKYNDKSSCFPHADG